MGAFEFVALDQKGKESKGLLEGDTPKHVRQILRERQLLRAPRENSLFAADCQQVNSLC